MKLLTTIQVAVLIGLLFSAILCLSYKKPGAFVEIDRPDLHLQFISKLESEPPFPGKEQTIAVLKSMIDVRSSGLKALRADAELIEALGYGLLALAFLQGVGIAGLWRSRKGNA